MNGTRNVAVTNVFGSNLRNSKNLYDVTDAEKCENVRYSDQIITLKDSMDVTFTGDGADLTYMGANIGTSSSKIKFSVSTKFSNDCEFTFNSKNANNCFMCLGFQKASYCVLNQQYEKEEYYKVVDEIKTEMLKRGEYADGVGMEFCAQAYNFSIGQISFPLTKEEIEKLGGYMAKDPETSVDSQNLLLKNQLPETILETTEEILNKAIKCELTGKPFRVILSELQFYKMMKLPLPSVHPSIRMEGRIKLLANGKKYETTCAKCGKDIVAVFDPVQKFILYCEDCFKKEIY
jgi:CxxC-x17-CxxC domain-containing protein